MEWLSRTRAVSGQAANGTRLNERSQLIGRNGKETCCPLSTSGTRSWRKDHRHELRGAVLAYLMSMPDSAKIQDNAPQQKVRTGSNHLGYLKREVAEWFAPKMDRNEAFIATLYRLRDDGTLIPGVFEV
jgi:hypothetical protein